MKHFTQIQEKQAMDKVLEVRYSDIELEQSLCLELLEWGTERGDDYVTAFAHTYLGDCFVAKGDMAGCVCHLMEARDYSIVRGFYDLLVRIYSLLGIYYEMVADEQSSLQYYMEGITAARRVGDHAAEGLILNNIASNFQRHHGYEQAFQFYKAAYELIDQSEDGQSIPGCIVLNNLAMISTHLGRLDEVEYYIKQCEKRGGDSELIHILCAKDWCQYYTAIGNTIQAEKQVKYILSIEEKISANRLYAFDVYTVLFDSMMQLRNATAAAHFLAQMEECCADSSADQLRQLEEDRMTYCLAFESDEDKTAAAYQHYCQRTIALAKMGDQTITNGLKAAIQLFEVARQKEKLNAEQNDLKNQVHLDELTQVYNRRYLEELIRQYENSPTQDSIGFIMLDVDCLKEYNDTYGHPAGDDVLRAVGRCLKSHAPASIAPCRFGGDEFVCLAIGLHDQEIVTYLNAVRDDLQKINIPHSASHCAQQVTLSIGFSNQILSPGLSVRTLLEWADKALYCSKMSGRNTYSKHG